MNVQGISAKSVHKKTIFVKIVFIIKNKERLAASLKYNLAFIL